MTTTVNYSCPASTGAYVGTSSTVNTCQLACTPAATSQWDPNPRSGPCPAGYTGNQTWEVFQTRTSVCNSTYGSPTNSAWTDTSTTKNLNTSQCAVLQSDYKVSVTLPLGGTVTRTNQMASTAQKIGCRKNPMTLDGVEPPEWNLAPTYIISSGSFSIWNNGDHYSANLNTLNIVSSDISHLAANRIVSVGGRDFIVDYFIDCEDPDESHRGIHMASVQYNHLEYVKILKFF